MIAPVSRRRGVTIVELLIAAAISSILIAMLTGSVILYGRYYRRGDALLEQSRHYQQIVDRFREDFRQATGQLRLSELPEKALRDVGLDRSREVFLEAPRAGSHVLHTYLTPDSPSPSSSETYAFEEVWSLQDLEDPGKAQAAASRYRPPIPPSDLQTHVRPRAPISSVFSIAIPSEDPRSWYVIFRHEREGTGTPIIWAYHREKVLEYPPKTLIRWTPDTGVIVMTEGDLEKFNTELLFEWIQISRPREGVTVSRVEMSKFLVRLDVAFAPSAPMAPPVGGTAFIVMEP